MILKNVSGTPWCADTGVESVALVLEDICVTIGDLASAPAAAVPTPARSQQDGTKAPALAVADVVTTPNNAAIINVPASLPAIILCAGPEAREASEALATAWRTADATTAISVEDAALTALTNAAKQRAQVVIAVECTADGCLGDDARGLAAQLQGAPPVIKAQLRQLRFALLSVAATDYGNAGERASANASRDQQARTTDLIRQTLATAGATCVASVALDLQDTDEVRLSALINDVRLSFSGGATGGLPASRPTVSPLATTPKTAPVGTPVLKIADTATELPAEVAGEPSDVLARFSFEADQAKVVDVRELRQSPKADQGLSTVEVSIEANDGLATYDLGGTLSVLPECDPDDVMKMLPVLGLTQIDLVKFITFVTAEGGDTLLKRPFPTPCTLGVALRQYCDLGRAPSKKMLSALCPKLKDEGARERISKLIANADSLKAVQSEELCLRMHEFWSLVGVTSIDLSDFLIHCSRQKAREFTIASSSKATPGVIKICVSLTSRVAADMTSMMQTLEAHGCLLPSNSLTPLSTTTRDRFFGMCSRWLTSRLKVD